MVDVVMHIMFCPINQYLIGGFYAVWMLIYVIIYVTWDARSKKTAPWHISQLRERLPPVHSAAIFASSLLMILGAAQPQVRQELAESVVPLLMVGIAGTCFALADICPYRVPVVRIAGQRRSLPSELGRLE